ncbi:hypothetical protein CLIM01_00676 [Colletotrichum limetticola]|uniref:Uncharacterized protein n=1 Tax=Colletotrichum limetticola TaxID=1209924 RepID=A0ABQ9QE82_9PEZI|nr:hypothetical protein CLIM01_00676 [Colletotrichum limetticola]
MRLLRIQLTSCDQRSYLLPLALRHNPRRHCYNHRAQAGVLRSTKLLEAIIISMYSLPSHLALVAQHSQAVAARMVSFLRSIRLYGYSIFTFLLPLGIRISLLVSLLLPTIL